MDSLVFEVAGVRYALSASDVRGVERMVALVPLPKAPAIVEGVVDVRGEVVPVLDLRARFRLPPREAEATDVLVLADAGDRTAALRADRALDVIDISPSVVEDARRTVPSAEYVAGVAKLPDGIVLIHDLRTFLTEAEREALDGV